MQDAGMPRSATAPLERLRLAARAFHAMKAHAGRPSYDVALHAFAAALNACAAAMAAATEASGPGAQQAWQTELALPAGSPLRDRLAWTQRVGRDAPATAVTPPAPSAAWRDKATGKAMAPMEHRVPGDADTTVFHATRALFGLRTALARVGESQRWWTKDDVEACLPFPDDMKQ